MENEKVVLYKKRVTWTPFHEQLLMECWSRQLPELRGPRKNTHIYKEMSQELNNNGLEITAKEIKLKINNLSTKYKKEKAQMELTARPSAWVLYPKVHKILCSNKSDNDEIAKENDFGNLVVKKWTQLRDTGTRAFKKRKLDETARPYIYNKEMGFLKNIVVGKLDAADCNGDDICKTEELTSDENENEEDDEERDEEEEDNDEVTHNTSSADPLNVEEPPTPIMQTTAKQKKRSSVLLDELDCKMLKFIDSQMQQKATENHDDNHHMYFFRGLLPSLTSLNADETLQFQAEVIKVMQKIKSINKSKY